MKRIVLYPDGSARYFGEDGPDPSLILTSALTADGEPTPHVVLDSHKMIRPNGEVVRVYALKGTPPHELQDAIRRAR